MLDTADKKKSTNSKHCLIMDEVDGMAGNEDRGGIQVRCYLLINKRSMVF